MDIGLMVEGQNGLTWERWLRILRMTERLGFPSLFRSDHYFVNPNALQDSLEAFISFAVAARETERIRFGALVTPVTFRPPVEVARMAAQIDLLSGGRFVLGLGAGWNEAEHRAYGHAFPPVKERFDRLQEAVLLMDTLWEEDPATFEGRYYQLEGAHLLPKPAPGRPPLLIGGNGEKRTLNLAARLADEWNAVHLDAEGYRAKLDVFEQHCEEWNRDPAEVKRSMMVFGIVGPDERSRQKAALDLIRSFRGREDVSPDQWREGLAASGFTVIGGSTDEVVDLLGRLAGMGVSEVQFQHFDYDSDEVPAYLASEIVPRVKGL